LDERRKRRGDSSSVSKEKTKRRSSKKAKERDVIGVKRESNGLNLGNEEIGEKKNSVENGGKSSKRGGFFCGCTGCDKEEANEGSNCTIF